MCYKYNMLMLLLLPICMAFLFIISVERCLKLINKSVYDKLKWRCIYCFWWYFLFFFVQISERRNWGAQCLSCLSRNIFGVFYLRVADDANHHRKYRYNKYPLQQLTKIENCYNTRSLCRHSITHFRSIRSWWMDWWWASKASCRF